MVKRNNNNSGGKRKYKIPKAFASTVTDTLETQDSSDTKSSKRQRSGPATVSRYDLYEADKRIDNTKNDSDLDMTSDEDNERSKVAEGDDEEIDEDEAFDDQDEERWGEHFQSTEKSQPNAVVNDEINLLDENEEGMDDPAEETEPPDFENDSDAVDISTMFEDGPVIAIVDSELMVGLDQSESDQEYSEFESDLNDEYDSDNVDDSRLDDVASAALNAIQTRRSSKEDTKKSRSNERSQGFDESEFNLTPASSKLSLDALMGTDTQDAEISVTNTLKTQIRSMQKEKSGQATVAVPLAVVTQERIERQAAYSASSKEISKWLPIIQKNRKAEHLEFPLNEQHGKNAPSITTSTLASSAPKSMTPMEAEIEEMLQKSGMKSERDIVKSEELSMNAINPEEVKAQRDEMAKMRALLFYHEQKEKRASKIKSKKYHRIKKKEKEHEAAKLGELDELDPQLADEERLKLERLRAEERMNLRHKTGSKWCKRMLHAGDDEGSRSAITENLRIRDSLMKKIEGRASDDSDDESERDEDEADSRAVQELASMENELAGPAENLPTKGLMSMKFMQNAMAVQRAEAQSRIQALRREYKQDDDDEITVPVNPGRMSFGSVNSEKQYEEYEESDGFQSSDNDTQPAPQEKTKLIVRKMNETKPVKSVNNIEKPVPVSNENENQSDDDTSNPWMNPIDGIASFGNKGAIKGTKIFNETDGQRADKSKQKLVKAAMKHEARLAAKQFNEAASEDDSDTDTRPVMLKSNYKSEVSFLSQRNLIEMAFANDNVLEREFAEEKARVMDMDAPKEVDVTLPGWGSWSGAGVKPNPNARRFMLPPKPDAIPVNKRQDKNLAHVIINERKDNKFQSVYSSPTVPFPYQNKEQYEAVHRNPVGREWNAARTHHKQTKPRIIAKAGTIIDPLKFTKQPKDRKK